MRGGNLKPKHLKRRRVNQMLEMIWEIQLFFLTAPMGYGKTCAFRDYLEDAKTQREFILFWFRFHEGEADVDWFWKNYQSMIARQCERLGREYQIEEQRPQTVQEMYYYFQRVNEILNQDVVCVFDDYQKCNAQELNYMLEAMAYEKIPRLHLVVVGRSYPKVAYEELCLKGKCILMEQEDMRFTREETAEFFQENGYPLTEQELDTCVSYTDGWVAAVQLCLLEYQKSERIKKSESMASLVRSEVFAKLSPREKEIVMKISQLETAIPEQVAYIMGDKQAPAMLMKIAENMDFIRYDAMKYRFELHDILKAVGEEELLKAGSSREEVIRRNAEYYEASGKLIPAFMTYRRLEEREQVYRLLKQHGHMTLFRQAMDLFERIYEEMPWPVRLADGMWYLQFLYTKAAYGDFTKGMDEYGQLREYLMKRPTVVENNGALQCQGFFEIMRHFNDVSSMMKVAIAFIAVKGIDKLQKINMEIQGLYALPRIMYILHAREGEYQKEQELAFQYADTVIPSPIRRAWKTLILSEREYDHGNFREAKRKAHQAMLAAQMTERVQTELSASGIYMKSCLFLGEEEAAKKELTKMEGKTRECGIEYIYTEYQILRADINGMLGNSEELQQWIGHTKMTEYSSMIRKIGYLHVISARKLILDHSFVALEVLAQNMVGDERYGSFIFKYIFADLFLSIACWNSKREKEAVTYLQKAAELARPDHLISAFAEFHREILPVLEVAVQQEIEQQEEMKYLQEIYQFSRKLAGQESKAEEKSLLTPREQEIMACVRKGMKNQQISDALHLALVTVEKNLSNIYRKLGVKNRAGAIAAYEKKSKE